MWQKLRLYCACRWGRASREAHAGPEPGVSSLSSKGLNLIHREESVSHLLLPTGVNLRRQVLPVSMQTSSQMATQSQVLWPVYVWQIPEGSMCELKSSPRGLATDQGWQAPLAIHPVLPGRP